MFSAFGTIKACEVAGTGVPNKHKGFGYIEYDAEQGMNVSIM